VLAAKRQSGLTLTELVLAIALTTLVAGSTGAILRSVDGARERADRQMSLQQETRAAVGAIASALQSAYRGGGNEFMIEGLANRDGDFPSDRVRFFTIGEYPVRSGELESDVRECEFSLLAGPTEADLGVLMRRVDPTRNPQPDGGGVVERIAAHVLGLQLEYFDGERWRDDWPRTQQAWPAAIRIDVAVASASTPRKVWSVSRTVNFPYPPNPQEMGKAQSPPTEGAQPAGGAGTPSGLPDAVPPADARGGRAGT
jgi:hypothetical protein